MTHSSIEIRFNNKGKKLGVFATDFIPKGTVIYTIDYVDLLLSKISGTNSVDSITEKTKLFNHKENPNSMTTAYGFNIAIQDIQDGEEITEDLRIYPLISSGIPVLESEELKTIDNLIIYALEEIREVRQPLFEYISPIIMTAVNRFFVDIKYYRSLHGLIRN
jgi:uncharacterized protein